MTGEELAQALLDRIAAKRKRGEFTLTATTLEQLLREALPQSKERESGPPLWRQVTEDGYPKMMTKPRTSTIPWAQAPTTEVPEKTYVYSKEEEEDARRRGFSV